MAGDGAEGSQAADGAGGDPKVEVLIARPPHHPRPHPEVRAGLVQVEDFMFLLSVLDIQVDIIVTLLLLLGFRVLLRYLVL